MILLVLSATLLAAPLSAPETGKVYSPPEAIALSEANKRGKSAVFEMDVKETDRIAGVSYLNSADDYRSPTTLTFRISPNVRKILERRYNASPEAYFKGKHVVVKGTVTRDMIVNKNHGRPVGFNRWQHTVKIVLASQIVSVS